MYNLTKPQQLIYDMEKFAGGSIATVCGSIIIKGKKDIKILTKAVNELYRLNDALRIKIIETDGVPYQTITEYQEQEINVLRFKDKAELDELAEKIAREPMGFYGSLCHTQIVVLEDAYGLLVKLHHIISDAWTLALIGSQFNSILKGETPETYSYLDYIYSEQKYLEGKRYQKDKDYYIEQFRKCDETTYLSDKQSSSYISQRKTFVVDKEKTAKITTYADKNNTSLFMLLMTALGVYINRIKMNQEKFYVGTAVLNRNGLAEQNTMGMFINTVPVLFELENNSTFKENLDKFSENMMTMLRHQKFNYGDVLKALRSEFDFTGNLYDVMLSFQNAKMTGMEDNFESTWYHCGMQTESLQMHIDDRDNEGILKIYYDYQTEKFTEKEIDKMHEHIFNLLFDAISEDKKITTITVLSEKETNVLLYDFNNTKADYPKDKCVHQLFEEQVLKSPDKTAVIATDKTLTYDELNKLSNRIANSLIQKGVKANDIVAFALPRNSYLIAVMFGILKSGAAYMPIDPDYPQDRIDYMLEDSGAKIFIIEENINEFVSSNEENPSIEITSNNYCYCIYTSGSTGNPKGTLLYHKGIVNLITNLAMYHDVSIVNTIGFATTITFDVATQEILTALLGGFIGVLLPERKASSPDEIISIMQKNKIDMIYATPSYFDMLTSKKEWALQILNQVNTVVLAGEKFYLNSVVNELCQECDITFENQYGPAETHVVSCSHIFFHTGKNISRLETLSKTEKNILLCDFNDTKADYPKDKCIHQLFEEQVLKTPDKTAVIACDKTLTYDELNRLSNRIANSLIEKDVKANDIVAFALPRNSYLIAVMFGILKAGAAYMPIDPDYPRDRIDYMLSDSNAKFFITENNLNEFISDNEENPTICVSPSNYYCALHTSGSTGTPKMSLLYHKGIMNFLYANTRFYDKVDTVVSATIITFDAFIMDSVLAISYGKPLYLMNSDEMFNQNKFENVFKNISNAMFFSTPTKLKSYIDNSSNKEFVKSIKSFVLGGEIFTEDLFDLINENTDNSNIYNIYGPTETTICVVVDELKNHDITIGKPIANTQIYILDKYNNPMPIGQIGELCIAGDGVGAGYLNRPELTAEKFIDNPFGEGKMYKTGDLAYWREDGNIAYVGRNDFQVKIRGLRIELGEIESAIDSVDGVSQAVVVVRKYTNGRQLICAFYTEHTSVDIADIKSAISSKLPKYMMPHIFTVLSEMPLTPSGKINRKALPEVDLTNISNDVEYIQPQTEIQRVLASIMENILNYSPIGLHDNFFDLGGDSLKAIEFISKAHSEGIYFNLQDVFDNLTLEKLCESIENNDKQNVSFADVDFTKINKILSKNKTENIIVSERKDVGNILLAGATGFLGMHLLSDFLDNDNGIAYCLVRGIDAKSAKERFNELLHFYFGEKYDNSDRIVVICADLHKEKFDLNETEYNTLLSNIDTIINAAATVKHYGSYEYFCEANVETVHQLIDFCKKSNAKLIHTSTLSVSGNSFEEYENDHEIRFGEDNLYIGQPLDNVYARSKFEAEKTVIEAMCDGLRANIMRMGVLSNRYSDCVFQRNYESNAFLKRIMAIIKLGVIPKSFEQMPIEFTPIDLAANAVMTITRNFNSEFNVFHICNVKTIPMGQVINYLNKLDIKVNIIEDAEFYDALKNIKKNDENSSIFEAFANDFKDGNKLDYSSKIVLDNDFSVEYLKQLGFEWSEIDFEYIKRYIEYFIKIGCLEV